MKALQHTAFDIFILHGVNVSKHRSMASAIGRQSSVPLICHFALLLLRDSVYPFPLCTLKMDHEHEQRESSPLDFMYQHVSFVLGHEIIHLSLRKACTSDILGLLSCL